MNCKIDTTIKERVFEFFSEYSFTADDGKRIGFYVTRRLDDFDAYCET